MSKYGILLITGSHTHQENYAAAFAADKRCKLIALTDEPDVDSRRRELNERLARALDVPYVADVREALKNRDVNVVCNCAPPDRRGRIGVWCVEAGKHLYQDKSLAPQLAEADALVSAVKKAGVKSHMFSFVSQPWAREAKKLLDRNGVGKLVAIHGDCYFAKGKNGTAILGKPRQEEFPPHRHQVLDAKRELDNCGVYPIGLIGWLSAKKFRSVYAVTGNYFFAEHQKNNVEDFGIMTCTLEDGTTATIAAGRYGWTSHPAGGVNRIILVGSDRTFIADANRPRLEMYTDDKPWTPPNVNRADPMGFWSSTMAEVHLRTKTAWAPLHAQASDASYFIDCLESGRESEMSVVEAAHATEVLVAAFKSAATKQVVTLPLER